MTFERNYSPLFFALALSAAACHAHVDGILVELDAEVTPTATLTDEGGTTVELERFDVELAAFELLPCEDAVARVLRELVFPGRARAHHPGHDSPTTLDLHLVVDVVAGGAVELGSLNPPPGRYCGAMLSFGEAHLEGSSGARSVDRALGSAGTYFYTFDALELSAANLDARVLVRLELGALFAGLDLATASDAELDEAIRAGLEGLTAIEAALLVPE